MWNSDRPFSALHHRLIPGRWLILALALVSCVPFRSGSTSTEGTEHAAADPSPGSPVLTRQAALTVAQEEVTRQPVAAQYLPDSVVINDAGDRWEVRVSREGGARTRPAYGLFFIHKATGEIQWVPKR